MRMAAEADTSALLEIAAATGLFTAEELEDLLAGVVRKWSYTWSHLGVLLIKSTDYYIFTMSFYDVYV